MTAGSGASPARDGDTRLAEPTYGVVPGLGGVQWLYEVDGDEQVGIGPVGSLLHAAAEVERLRAELADTEAQFDVLAERRRFEGDRNTEQLVRAQAERDAAMAALNRVREIAERGRVKADQMSKRRDVVVFAALTAEEVLAAATLDVPESAPTAARLTEVAARHQPYPLDDRTLCRHCGREWPCADAVTAGETG